MVCQLFCRMLLRVETVASVLGSLWIWVGREHSIRLVQQRGYGAMAARLTPDQKVGRSNRSGLIFLDCLAGARGTAHAHLNHAVETWPHWWKTWVDRKFRDRELNPGLLRDRQKY